MTAPKKANRANTDAWTAPLPSKRSVPAQSVWQKPLNEVLTKQEEHARKARYAIRVVLHEE